MPIKGVCVGARPPVRYQHVLVIWMENKSFDDVIGSGRAPYENDLAAGCGLATNYRAIAHPSLPNYIAATSGGTWGIVDDVSPFEHPLSVPSVYEQVSSWREYAEGAPSACPTVSAGLYVQKHDPALYYTRLSAACSERVLPIDALDMDLARDTLPAYGVIVPNLCNDMHDCSVQTGDSWLRTWVGKIVGSSAYRHGRTALFIAWDESDSANPPIPLIAVARSIHPGARPAGAFDHYSLLRTTEQLLGVPYLAAARSAASMARPFGLLRSASH